MDKQEIVDAAKAIGTYDISTRAVSGLLRALRAALPGDHDRRLEQADEAEAKLDIDALVGKALAGIETREISSCLTGLKGGPSVALR